MSLASRRVAAAKYRPARVDVLLVAEAPPCSPDRYFYFERVDQHDGLFRYVWEAVNNEKPDRAVKPEHLAALRNLGFFLIDLHEDSISKPSLAQLRPKIPDLVERCRELNPKRIVLIKASVYDTAYEHLRSAGLPVVNERIPFPSSGQQKKFLEAFRRALKTTP